MVKLDNKVTVLSGPCFFREILETFMRKKVGKRAEATGEKREWPATEQSDTGADCGPVWALEGLGRGQGPKVLEQPV